MNNNETYQLVIKRNDAKISVFFISLRMLNNLTNKK